MREPNSWRGDMTIRYAMAIPRVFTALLLMAGPTAAAQEEMCALIRRDVAAYLATGHPCACPYNLTRAGRPCGNLSAWSKPGGSAPRCYFEDFDGTSPPLARGQPRRVTAPPPPACPSPVNPP